MFSSFVLSCDSSQIGDTVHSTEFFSSLREAGLGGRRVKMGYRLNILCTPVKKY